MWSQVVCYLEYQKGKGAVPQLHVTSLYNDEHAMRSPFE